MIFIAIWWVLFWITLYEQGSEVDVLDALLASGEVAAALFLTIILIKVGNSLLRAAWYNDERLQEYNYKKERGYVVRAHGNQTGKII